MTFFLKNNSYHYLILLLGFTACHDKAALKQALIDKNVKEKVENHIRKKKRTCAEETMKEALVLADSFMIKLALSKADTSNRINKPVKPSRPSVDLPIDTTPIKPLFNDTIRRIKDTTLVLEKPKIIQNDTI